MTAADAAALLARAAGVCVTALDPASPLSVDNARVQSSIASDVAVARRRLARTARRAARQAESGSLDMLYDVAVGALGGLLDTEFARVRYAGSAPTAIAPWVLSAVSATMLMPYHVRVGVRSRRGSAARPVPTRALLDPRLLALAQGELGARGGDERE